MKKNNFKIKYMVAGLVALFMTSSCVGDLDVTPINPQVTQVFNQDQVFAKVYASFSLTGQEGPAGNGDVEGLDEGRFSLIRCLWNCNELSTDEALCSWGDAEVTDLNKNTWTASNQAFDGLYARLYFVVTISNHFMEQTEGKSDDVTLKQRAEVRFLRALAYYYLMDNFGNVPFTEKISSVAPKQIKRKDLFKWIESELKACEPDMYEPRTAPYYRVDKVANWLLMSRLYLNGEVYTSVPATDASAAVPGDTYWDEAAVYAKKVIDSNYELAPVFRHLFMGDNAGTIDGSDVNKASQEIIFPFAADGVKTQSWGNSMFLIASTRVAGMPEWGTTEGWGGNRVRPGIVKVFFPGSILVSSKKDLTTGLTSTYRDYRALFYGDTDRTLSIPNIGKFKEGYSVIKYSNARADGGRILLIKSLGVATSGATTYSNVSGVVPRTGIGRLAKFTVSKADGTYNVTITDEGLGYKVGDTITVAGGDLGGINVVNDLKIIPTKVVVPHDPKYVDMDIPFMRKAEAYLTYAEAVLRGGAKIDAYEPLAAMNALRTRASAKLYTTVALADVINERAREFFFEGHRRSDLIRFNMFGGNTGYTWEWKGGVQAGVDFPVEYNLFPIPANDLNANANLVQNPGY